MMTVSSQPSSANSLLDIETETDYLKVAKKGGGHKGTCIVIYSRKHKMHVCACVCLYFHSEKKNF